MNGILSKSPKSANAIRTNTNRPHIKSVETAGSLAMMNYNPFAGMLSTPLGDMFSSSNPFSVDYEQWAMSNYVPSDCIGFLGGFENALSTISSSEGFSESMASSFSDGGFSDCGFSSASAISGSGFSGASSGCSSFSSVC